jgi:transgelin
MDLDLAKKQLAKKDPQRDAEAAAWIEELTGEKIDSKDLENALKSGVTLCK